MRTSWPTLAILCGLLPVSFSASAQDWSITIMPEAFWSGVACSADGMKLVLDGYSSGIWVSTNRGVSWNPTPAPIDNYHAIASSPDGAKLAAVSEVAQSWGVYISTNAGATWVLTPAVPIIGYFQSVAISADGTKLAAT